jgi:hypothetical protein
MSMADIGVVDIVRVFLPKRSEAHNILAVLFVTLEP